MSPFKKLCAVAPSALAAVALAAWAALALAAQAVAAHMAQVAAFLRAAEVQGQAAQKPQLVERAAALACRKSSGFHNGCLDTPHQDHLGGFGEPKKRPFEGMSGAFQNL